MSDVAVIILILVIVVIILLVKLSSLREKMDSRANELARSMLDGWKATEMQKSVAREVELSISAIRNQAKNDIQQAHYQARLDLQTWKTAEGKLLRQDAINRSEATHKGKITEHLAALFLNDIFDPRDIRFIGSPIDLVVFHGLAAGYIEAIHFIEVKSGKSAKLAPREELVRGAALAGRVAYNIVHFADDDSDIGISVNWLGGTPPPKLSQIMNEELRMLITKKSEACRAIDVDTQADLDILIYENFGRSMARLADEVAILRDELKGMKPRDKKPRKNS